LRLKFEQIAPHPHRKNAKMHPTCTPQNHSIKVAHYSHNPPVKLYQFHWGIELSLPYGQVKLPPVVKLLRSEVCFASDFGANLTSLCAEAQGFTMPQA